jgi:hypothetical protein
MSDSYGAIVEEQARRIAAGAGVPDFVYRPVDVRKGQGQREVCDALLWIGRRLVVVSMKSRDPSVSETDERRDRWLEKHTQKAVRQIEGTVRTLSNSPKGLILRSERGVSIPWNPEMLEEITGAVVIDHPGAGQYMPRHVSDAIPTIVLGSDDWRFIHERLWSTCAVVKYLSWRARCGITVPLAAERDVFAAAMIEEADRPAWQIPSLVRVTPGLWVEALRARPEEFFGTNPDDRYAQLIDVLIEAVSEIDPLYSTVSGPADYLEITEFLDRIPPFHRVTIAKAILDKCNDVGSNGGRRSLLATTPSGLLVFVANAAERSERAKHLQALAAVRHSQTIDATGNPELVTLGIATEGSGAGGRSHDFVLIRGRITLNAEEAKARDEAFGGLPVQIPTTLASVAEWR